MQRMIRGSSIVSCLIGFKENVLLKNVHYLAVKEALDRTPQQALEEEEAEA